MTERIYYKSNMMCQLCSRCGTGVGEHEKQDRSCEFTYWPSGTLPMDEEVLPDKLSDETWDSYYYKIGL